MDVRDSYKGFEDKIIDRAMDKEEIKRQDFAEAVKPIHDWLCKYGDPYMAVIVKQYGAQIFEETMEVPLPVPD